MADEQTADSATQDAESATDETQNASTTTTDEQKPKSDVPDGLTVEDAWKTIQNQRAAERDAKKRADAAEKRAKALEDEKLSADQKLKRDYDDVVKERDAYATQLREYRAKDAVFTAARGALKPDAIWRMVRADIEYDDDGTPNNVKALVDAARKDTPELFTSRNGSADGGANGATAPQGFNRMIREAAGRPV